MRYSFFLFQCHKIYNNVSKIFKSSLMFYPRIKLPDISLKITKAIGLQLFQKLSKFIPFGLTSFYTKSVGNRQLLLINIQLFVLKIKHLNQSKRISKTRFQESYFFHVFNTSGILFSHIMFFQVILEVHIQSSNFFYISIIYYVV